MRGRRAPTYERQIQSELLHKCPYFQHTIQYCTAPRHHHTSSYIRNLYTLIVPLFARQIRGTPQTSLMELNLPYPHTPVCTRPHYLPLPTLTSTQPKHSIDTPTNRVLNRDILHWLLDAPDVDVCVEGAGRAMQGVGSP